MDTRVPRVYPAEPRLLYRVEVSPKESLPGNGPARSLVDTRQGQRVSVEIRHLAGGYCDRLHAYPSREAAGFLLESPSILGTTMVIDESRVRRIRAASRPTNSWPDEKLTDENLTDDVE